MTAEVKFPSREMAKTFASAWTFRVLTGHCISATKKDGETTVTIYNVTDELKTWVDEKIAEMNKGLVKN